ncbi:MAG: glycerol-3-phosphate dehydrogenase, partial [Chloroflexi bacterium]|nr:glycerol-3-phosphate dehydrogenase [Chloroflexota bacterium]
MARVTILGAGDMGTALLTPLRAGNHELRLWGTKHDTVIVEALGRGDPHPRLGISLPPGVAIFRAEEVAAALEGAEIV